jgi:crotonobetainyl-CoA:carnitine CoA-transferase CaiB-like acyl-CoA transferase
MNKQKGEDGILSSYRVLDLTSEKGIFCSRLLADMGAEVIRVDQKGTELSGSPFFTACNLGKCSITLDLEPKKGQELFRRLAGTADVIVESYQPGYLGRLGLDYAELSSTNPQLVMTSITDFGQNGPHENYKSRDLVASALGGWMSTCGEPDMPPLKPFGHQAYYTACLFATMGVMLALLHRHSTDKGQHVAISIAECVTATLDHALVRYFYEREVAGRQGSLHWDNSFRIFPCQDGYILLSLFQQWETQVELLNAEGMAEDLTNKKWLDRETRAEGIGHIIEVMERWTKKHKVAELVEKGQLMHFPWAEVCSIPQVLENPQLKARGFFTEVEDPVSGKKHGFPGPAGKLSQSPWQTGIRVPVAGEHNTEVYQGELGLSRKEIEALVREGVI